MKTNRLLVFIFIIFCHLSLVGPSWAGEDARALYDQYLSAYKSYQDAVNRQAPEAEVKQLLATFNQARSAYERSVSTGNASTGTDDWAATSEALGQPSGEPGVGEGTGPATPNPTPAKSRLPAALSSILKDLWGGSGRKIADKGIRSLERFAAANPKSAFAVTAKYEIAKAYEYLKDDRDSSTKVLQQIVKDPSAGAVARVAQERIRYLEATKKFDQWKVNLKNARVKMDDAYAKYRNTSWLAFPVKGFRWAGYVGKLLSFNNTQDDFQKFQLGFEAAAAPFAPPVDITFDQFKVPYGKEDEISDVRLVYDNNNSWYARWKLISEAKSSIDLQYFIVEEDAFGMALCGLLLKKAREGLKIRFMMDARGTKTLTRAFLGQKFVKELASFPNVEVKTFNPVHTNLATMLFDIRLIMASNHDKIVVVDNEYAVVGGRNVSSHYYSDPIDMPEAYRDCDVVIKNPDVARQLDQAFEEEFAPLKQYEIGEGEDDSVAGQLEAARLAMDWYIKYGRVVNGRSNDKKVQKALEKHNKELSGYKCLVKYGKFELLAGAHEAPVKIIDKDSLFGDRNDITDQLVRFIDGSRREIIIQNPYVVLTERAEAALIRASRRGVKIIFHTNSPYSTDSLATQAMFYADWKRILKGLPTGHIYTYYGKRKLHAKNFEFDGKVGIIGTYNMDYMSEEINSEVVAAIKSTSFAGELRREILSDVAVSKEYKIEIEADGDVKSVFGPDDLPGKKMWLMKFMSKLTFLKKII